MTKPSNTEAAVRDAFSQIEEIEADIRRDREKISDLKASLKGLGYGAAAITAALRRGKKDRDDVHDEDTELRRIETDLGRSILPWE
jgi:uncharacterized protein (UPF0335 family)